MKRAGIFGPSMSGKTTLAKALSRQYWLSHKVKSLVLDPHLEAWGDQAIVTAEEERFWQIVWASRNCIVIVEEAAATINRERELVPVFTRLRHNDHRLIVVGHSGADLLPVMRQQIDTLYLFRQPGSAAKIWAETFAEPKLFQSTELKQYEFLHCQLFQEPRKLRLTLGK